MLLDGDALIISGRFRPSSLLLLLLLATRLSKARLYQLGAAAPSRDRPATRTRHISGWSRHASSQSWGMIPFSHTPDTFVMMAHMTPRVDSVTLGFQLEAGVRRRSPVRSAD
jgi:hypothetical protein